MSDRKSVIIKKSDLWRYSTFVLIAVIIIGAFFVFKGNDTDNSVTNTGTTGREGVNAQALVDDDPFMGNENAPVTIIEFSDYQCPFCRKFWTETLSLIKAEYIDTGKVRFVYRDFPLTSIHPAAEPAAQAAECVRDLGGDEAYFEMHDKIFQEGNILDGGDPIKGPVRTTVSFTSSDLKAWASEIGYDVGACLDSGKFRSEVLADFSDAQKAGGQGTPYFVINGQPLSGAQPFSAFKQVIDAELAA